MPELADRALDVGGRPARVLSAGDGPRTLLLLHTGAPGRSPIAGSADLFTGLVAGLDLDDDVQVLAPDLPGAGGTELHDLADLTTAGIAAFLEHLLAEHAPETEELHVLAQGEASLAALALARGGHSGPPVAGLFLLAPNAAAPIGDSVQNVSLLHPPEPRYTRRSQRWALDRLAYVPDRIGESVLDILVDNAQREPHLRAVDLLGDPANAAALLGAQIDAQDAFFAYCRDSRYRQPITVFWGAQDPTATVARGTVLASILGGGPAHLDFQLVNQCGHLAQYDRRTQLTAAVRSALTRVTVGR